MVEPALVGQSFTDAPQSGGGGSSIAEMGVSTTIECAPKSLGRDNSIKRPILDQQNHINQVTHSAINSASAERLLMGKIMT